MNEPRVVVFCCSGLDPSVVDPDFEEERDCAQNTGFVTKLMDHDEVSEGIASRGVRWVGNYESETAALYRGWMLSVERYQAFFEALKDRGLVLINDPWAYQTCHWLPESYHLIEGHTPDSAWIPEAELIPAGKIDWDRVEACAAQFGSSALVIKDYVKSQKHRWQEACFIEHANDIDALRRVISPHWESEVHHGGTETTEFIGRAGQFPS